MRCGDLTFLLMSVIHTLHTVRTHLCTYVPRAAASNFLGNDLTSYTYYTSKEASRQRESAAAAAAAAAARLFSLLFGLPLKVLDI